MYSYLDFEATDWYAIDIASVMSIRYDENTDGAALLETADPVVDDLSRGVHMRMVDHESAVMPAPSDRNAA